MRMLDGGHITFEQYLRVVRPVRTTSVGTHQTKRREPPGSLIPLRSGFRPGHFRIISY